MFLNKKRLLLTLYRLEEGQQDILQRLDKLERGWKDSSGKILRFAQNDINGAQNDINGAQNDINGAQNDRNGAQNGRVCHPEERSDEGSWREGLRKDSSGVNALRMTRGRPQNDGEDTEKPADTWIMDGIEAILSYRRNPKEETK